jgi:hypothetical protein
MGIYQIMVTIYQYNNSYVLDNTSYEVDVLKLGKVINQWLKDSGELQQDSMSRCSDVGGYVIIAPYGSLGGDNLLDFLRQYLKITQAPFEFVGDLPHDLVKPLMADLPKVTNYTKEQAGGSTQDTREIEAGVKPLCDALNELPFVETFSSCEGHFRHDSGTLYVLFLISPDAPDRFEVINDLSLRLDKHFEKAWSRFQPLQRTVVPTFMFNRGYWPGMEHIYFEIRIVYQGKYKETVFNAVKYIYQLFKEEVT